jgi:hypothetical protein
MLIDDHTTRSTHCRQDFHGFGRLKDSISNLSRRPYPILNFPTIDLFVFLKRGQKMIDDDDQLILFNLRP